MKNAIRLLLTLLLTGGLIAPSVASTVEIPSFLENCTFIEFVKLNEKIDLERITKSGFYKAKFEENYVVWDIKGDELLDQIAWYHYDELEGVCDKEKMDFKFLMEEDGTLWVGIEGGSLNCQLSFLVHPYGVGRVPLNYEYATEDLGLTDEDLKKFRRKWDLDKIGLSVALEVIVNKLHKNGLISSTADMKDKEDKFYFLEKGFYNDLDTDLTFVFDRINHWVLSTYDKYVIPDNLAWSPFPYHNSTGKAERGFIIEWKKIPEHSSFSIYAHADNSEFSRVEADNYTVEELNWAPGHAAFVGGARPEKVRFYGESTWSEIDGKFYLVYTGTPDYIDVKDVYQNPKNGMSYGHLPVIGFVKPGWTFQENGSIIDKSEEPGECLNDSNKQWGKTFGGKNDDVALSIQQTDDGGFVVAGYTESKCNGGKDAWVIKLDKYGNITK